MTFDRDRFVDLCTRSGLDIVHPFNISWFNSAALEDERLPELGRRDGLAFVVASSRALWPVLLRAVAKDPALATAKHPLDTYVTGILDSAVRDADGHAVVLYAHTVSPRAIPIQRIAERACLAHLGPAFLSVHPRLGPWFGFRAVVVTDAEGPPTLQHPANPCAGCEAPCVAALARAREATAGLVLDAAVVGDTWRLWAQIREACPVGRDRRYDDDQLEYHYTKQRSLVGATK
jgi:hypothetical protein